MSGCRSASRNLAERMSWSRARLAVLNDDAMRVAAAVAVTEASGTAGSWVTSPVMSRMMPDTVARPDRAGAGPVAASARRGWADRRGPGQGDGDRGRDRAAGRRARP